MVQMVLRCLVLHTTTTITELLVSVVQHKTLVLQGMSLVNTLLGTTLTGIVLEIMVTLFLVVPIITTIIITTVILSVTVLSQQMRTTQTIQTVGHVMQDTPSSVICVSGGITSQISLK